jgi:hypothetical protein
MVNSSAAVQHQNWRFRRVLSGSQLSHGNKRLGRRVPVVAIQRQVAKVQVQFGGPAAMPLQKVPAAVAADRLLVQQIGLILTG